MLSNNYFFFKEWKQSTTEEKQFQMIDIQNRTQEKVDQINNKQPRILESQATMIDNQNVIIALLGRKCKTNSITGTRVE